jgi:hypothetical protein
MTSKYTGKKIFQALRDIDSIKSQLRDLYPDFHFVAEKGDIAEAYAIAAYDLIKAPTGQSGYDAISKNGVKVSIKCLWEINAYRSLHLSGGSNRKEYAYRDADHLIVIGRDEHDGAECIIYNGPIFRLEDHIMGGAIHPRIDVRTLKKINTTLDISEKLPATTMPLPDARGLFYPKDLSSMFGVDKDYWQKFTMLWRNYPNRYGVPVTLNDFLEFGIGNEDGTPQLSENDVKFLRKCFDYYQKGYDHHTSAYAAYSKINNINFPELIRVGAENLKKLSISSSTFRHYCDDEIICKYLSYFLTMELKGPGGRTLQRYLTPHDVSIFERAYEIRNRRSRGAKGGNTDQVNYIVAGRIAAKEIGRSPQFILPDPRRR